MWSAPDTEARNDNRLNATLFEQLYNLTHTLLSEQDAVQTQGSSQDKTGATNTLNLFPTKVPVCGMAES